MDLLPYIESVQKLFPTVRKTEIIKQFDTSQKKFVDETKILTAIGELSDIDTYIKWTLPADFRGLKEVNYYDDDGYPIYEETTIGVDAIIDGDYIYFHTITGEELESELPTEIDSVQIVYYKSPTDITAEGSSFSIDEEFRDYLKEDVLASLYSANPVNFIDRGGNPVSGVNFNAVIFHAQRYQDGLRKTRKKINMNYDYRGVQALNYDFAGRLHTRKHQKPTADVSLSGASL